MGSLTLDQGFIDFLKQYLETHKIERFQNGKDMTTISIVREGLFLWAEKNGVLEDLKAHLKQQE